MLQIGNFSAGKCTLLPLCISYRDAKKMLQLCSIIPSGDLPHDRLKAALGCRRFRWEQSTLFASGRAARVEKKAAYQWWPSSVSAFTLGTCQQGRVIQQSDKAHMPHKEPDGIMGAFQE